MSLPKEEIKEIRCNDTDDEFFLLYPVELTHKSTSLKRHVQRLRLGYYIKTKEVYEPIKYITEDRGVYERRAWQEISPRDASWDLNYFNRAQL